MSYTDKIESLLDQAEAAFELTQDDLTQPEDVHGLWQRASYRLSLAQAYIGLVQVKNIEGVAGSFGKLVDNEGETKILKEN